MKNLTAITCMVLCFLSCKKDNDHGIVIITVKCKGNSVPNPTVYMKYGTLIKPAGLFQWDKTQSGGADGKAAFEDLPAGNYYFYATEHCGASYASGAAGVTVVSRYRQNRYEITIDLR